MLVGHGHELLGVLLESGGCSAMPQGIVRPDPFYVDQVATLEVFGTGLVMLRFVCDVDLRLSHVFSPNMQHINSRPVVLLKINRFSNVR